MSLLERGNTRLAPLDTVEPDGYRMFDGEGNYDFREELPDQVSIGWSLRYGRLWEPVYSRHTVESLLSQCRKEALLEAMDSFAGRGILYGYTVAEELRRMAEGEK